MKGSYIVNKMNEYIERDDLPTADVQPVKYGRWIYPYKDKDINQCPSATVMCKIK